MKSLIRSIPLLAVLGFIHFIPVIHSQVQFPPQVTSTSGLVASWAMSSGVDASGNNHNLTFTNTTSVVGKYNNAQQFNGTNSRGQVSGINLTTAFTLESWVYLGNNPPLLTRSLTFRRGVRATNGWEAIIYKGNDNFFLATANDFLTAGITTSTGLHQVTSPSELTRGQWHHYAVTYTGANFYLFIDGIIVATTSGVTGTIPASSEPVEVGGSVTYTGYLTGIIDDVRIYSRDLTGPEITSDMNTPIDTVSESVVSWSVEVWPRGTPVPPTGSPTTIGNFLKTAAICNQNTVTPPANTVVNPDTFRVTDPINSGKECEVGASTFFNSVPLGTGWFSTIRALGATTQSDRSPASNQFDRIASAQPPAVPGQNKVIDK